MIGASAGGIEALREVAHRLPADLEAAVFVVVHLPEGAKSTLPEILARSGALPAMHAQDGRGIERGRIYVAPPDHHLLLEAGERMRVARGPYHNRHRPAVDPLFTSAALAYGPRVVGVVLSGTLDDGTAGLARIKRAGGIAIVQDPATAAYSGMPENAIAHVPMDRTVPITELAAAIESSVRERVAPTAPVGERVQRWDMEFEGDIGARTEMEAIGKPSVYACPECHGALWEFDEEGILQFRCRVGHSFTSEGLLSEHDSDLEATLWAALRSLEENVSLRRRLARRMRHRKMAGMAERYDAKASVSEKHAATLRQVLTSESGPTAKQETNP